MIFCKIPNSTFEATVRHSHDKGDKAPKSLIYLNLSEFGKQLAGYHKQHFCGLDNYI